MKRHRKHSENAKAVAQEVIRTVLKGDKVVLRKIIPKHGYGKSIKNHAVKVTRTQSYQEEIKPFVERAVRERDRLIVAASEKDLSKETYDQIMRSVELLTKQIQLLTGGATDKVDISLTEILDNIEKENERPPITK